MRLFNNTIIPVLVFFLSINTLHGQEVDSLTQKKEGGFGGPDQVENQINKDEEPKTSFFELGFIQPYFEFKENLKEKSGFGMDIA